MLELENRTPFLASLAPISDQNGEDHLVVIIKGSFSVSPSRSPQSSANVKIADEQVAPRMVDEFFGEPAKSSIRYPSDLTLPKVGTDVAVVGHAYAPDLGKQVTAVDVQLRVGRLDKTIRVFGDRWYYRTLTFWRISEPKSFDRLPLVYERAYGGTDTSAEDPADHAVETFNPVGTGFTKNGDKTRLDGLLLPNLERSEALITRWKDRPSPTGFGFISRDWEPRRSHAGTYDETWERDRAPFLPSDFDPRFFSAAAPDLVVCPHLKGGEAVRLTNLSPDGPVAFALPEWTVFCALRSLTRDSRVDAQMDTVLIEPDARRLEITWSAAFPCTRRILDVDSIQVVAEHGLARE